MRGAEGEPAGRLGSICVRSSGGLKTKGDHQRRFSVVLVTLWFWLNRVREDRGLPLALHKICRGVRCRSYQRSNDFWKVMSLFLINHATARPFFIIMASAPNLSFRKAIGPALTLIWDKAVQIRQCRSTTGLQWRARLSALYYAHAVFSLFVSVTCDFERIVPF